FQAEDGIRDPLVTGVQTCALPIYGAHGGARTDVMTPDAGRRGRLVGFDWLRGIALFLVVLRHVLEVTNLPVTRDVLVLDQGQLEIGRASCRERVAVEVVGGVGEER